MSLQGVVGEFSTGTYTITRTPKRGYSTYGELDAVAGTATFLMDASVQPAGGALKALPEGRRAEDVRLIFCETELYDGATAGYEPDIITIDGDPFEIYDVDGPWTLDGFSHYQCSAARKRPTGGQ